MLSFRFPKLKTIPDSGMIHGLYDLICRVLRTTERSFRNCRFVRCFCVRSKPIACEPMLNRSPDGTVQKIEDMEFIVIFRLSPPEIP